MAFYFERPSPGGASCLVYMLPGYAELLALVNCSIPGIAHVPVQACVHVVVCV